MKENIVSFIVMLAVAAVICVIYKTVYTPEELLGVDVETAGSADDSRYTVVLDAGHGGFDPGKVGINGELEKEINLKIVYKLKSLLEQNDVRVILTREDDNGLYDQSDSNKKVSDMKRRSALINDSGAALVVSIHQNSYTSESISGAQVFYHKASEKSRQLAEIIQEELKRSVNPENNRAVKANDSYYLLKKTVCPIVIVECGFLSNSKEAELLSTDEYQESLAWAIHLGIMQCLNDSSGWRQE